ncbi:hypothetical protein C8R43DRAFT_673616 [Mycena crocata]|nr:hypothetical protein C8R43DRAFT_673616 [Mycena crocata]
MSASNPPNGVNIAKSVDAMFSGLMLCPLLLGIILQQAWRYYTSNKDGWMLQTFVAILVALDIASTCLTSEMAHIYMIQNFGNLKQLGLLPLSAIVEVQINVVICTSVELFFARRVYLLNQRRILVPTIISFLSIAGLVAGTFIVADISGEPTVAHLASRTMKIEVATTNGCYAAADLLNTIALSWTFYSNRGAVKSTNSLLERLLGFTVARGGLVTIAQSLVLILYVVQPTKLNWMPVHFMLAKLSIITMIAMYVQL